MKQEVWQLRSKRRFSVSYAQRKKYEAVLTKALTQDDIALINRFSLNASEHGRMRLCCALVLQFKRLYQRYFSVPPASFALAHERALNQYQAPYREPCITRPLATILFMIDKQLQENSKTPNTFCVSSNLLRLESIMELYATKCEAGAQERLDKLAEELLVGPSYGIQNTLMEGWRDTLCKRFFECATNIAGHKKRNLDFEIHNATRLEMRAHHEGYLSRSAKTTEYATLSDTSNKSSVSRALRSKYHKIIEEQKEAWSGLLPLIELSQKFLDTIIRTLRSEKINIEDKGCFPFISAKQSTEIADLLLPVFKAYLQGGAIPVAVEEDVDSLIDQCLIDRANLHPLPFYEDEEASGCFDSELYADPRIPLYRDWKKRITALFIASAKKILKSARVTKGAIFIPFKDEPYSIHISNAGRDITFTKAFRGETRPIVLEEPLVKIMNLAKFTSKLKEIQCGDREDQTYYLNLVPEIICQIIQPCYFEAEATTLPGYFYNQALPGLYDMLSSPVTSEHSYCYIFLGKLAASLRKNPSNKRMLAQYAVIHRFYMQYTAAGGIATPESALIDAEHQKTVSILTLRDPIDLALNIALNVEETPRSASKEDITIIVKQLQSLNRVYRHASRAKLTAAIKSVAEHKPKVFTALNVTNLLLILTESQDELESTQLLFCLTYISQSKPNIFTGQNLDTILGMILQQRGSYSSEPLFIALANIGKETPEIFTKAYITKLLSVVPGSLSPKQLSSLAFIGTLKENILSPPQLSYLLDALEVEPNVELLHGIIEKNKQNYTAENISTVIRRIGSITPLTAIKAACSAPKSLSTEHLAEFFPLFARLEGSRSKACAYRVILGALEDNPVILNIECAGKLLTFFKGFTGKYQTALKSQKSKLLLIMAKATIVLPKLNWAELSTLLTLLNNDISIAVDLGAANRLQRLTQAFHTLCNAYITIRTAEKGTPKHKREKICAVNWLITGGRVPARSTLSKGRVKELYAAYSALQALQPQEAAASDHLIT